jgi:hypothetical protein
VLTDGQLVAAVGALWLAGTTIVAALWKRGNDSDAAGEKVWEARLADRDKSEQRAWELVTALRSEAAESNRVIDKLADTVRELRDAIRTEIQSRHR